MSVQALFIGACGVIGLLFGSFANVLVHRLPLGESVVFPGSRCPACGRSIAWYDNLPVISYVALRGRCRHCDAPISARYPLLELCMGLTWAFAAWQFGMSAELLPALVLIMLLWVLTWIDLQTGLLPDVLTLPGIAIGLAFGLWFGHGQESLIGAAAGYGVFWFVARLFLLLTGREGMGYGDFKLLAMLGAFLGWQALPFIIFLSSLVGAVVGSIFLLLRGRHLRAQIPYGPYLALAGILWLFWGPGAIRWYGQLAGL